MLDNLPLFINRAASGGGFERTVYTDKNLPTDPARIIALPFFGNLRSTFILSSFLLKRWKENNPNKYLILCSYPGFEHLFPYVDEYWGIKAKSDVKLVALKSNNFYNNSNTAISLERNLNRFLKTDDVNKYYDNGFTKEFWEDFGDIKLYLPRILSSTVLSENFRYELNKRQGYKVLIFPVTKFESWQRGRLEYVTVPKEFWKCLINRLLLEGYVPISYQNFWTYDMSDEFASGCVYLTSDDLGVVLSAIHSMDCVLDLYSGISRLAMAARKPFIAVDERNRFKKSKDDVIDRLVSTAPNQYIFSFSVMLLNSSEENWDVNIINNIVKKMEKHIPQWSGKEWDETGDKYIPVSYDRIRETNRNRLGVRFINSRKDK